MTRNLQVPHNYLNCLNTSAGHVNTDASLSFVIRTFIFLVSFVNNRIKQLPAFGFFLGNSGLLQSNLTLPLPSYFPQQADSRIQIGNSKS